MQTLSKAALFSAATFIGLSGTAPAQAQMFRNGGFHTVGRHLVAPAPVDSVFDAPPVAPGGPPPFDIYADVYAFDPNYGWGGPGFGPRVYALRVVRAAPYQDDGARVRVRARRR